MQLKYDNDFKNIIDDLNIITDIENIPFKILDYLNSINNELVINDINTNKLYCPICFKKLNKNICLHCNKLFKYYKIEKYKMNLNVSNIKECRHRINYYIFDTKEDYLVLYIINNTIGFDNPNSFMLKKFNKYSIEKIYQVKKDGLFDINLNKYIYFNEYKKIIDYFQSDSETEYDFDDDIFNTFETFREKSFLYLENLEDLKKYDFYKYSYIWTLKDYFNTGLVNLKLLTYLPIYIKEFEYLVKMKLYNLAVDADSITYKGNFNDTFGIDKKYYKFMQKIDISLLELYSLRLYPTTNKKILDFVCDYNGPLSFLKDYADILKIKEYMDNQKLDYNYLYEYADYISASKELNMDLKDKNILFPKNLIESHNKLIKELEISKDPEIDERIKKLSIKLEKNKYIDDKYIIFPANSIDSLIDESSQMANCVKTYCKPYSENKCQIYFMRYKDNVNKSLVTIEVKNKKIVQAKMKYNEEITEEIRKIISEWEKRIII